MAPALRCGDAVAIRSARAGLPPGRRGARHSWGARIGGRFTTWGPKRENDRVVAEAFTFHQQIHHDHFRLAFGRLRSRLQAVISRHDRAPHLCQITCVKISRSEIFVDDEDGRLRLGFGVCGFARWDDRLSFQRLRPMLRCLCNITLRFPLRMVGQSQTQQYRYPHCSYWRQNLAKEFR